MWLFVVKMGRILQTLGLLDICFCGAPIRAWRPFFCRETSESSKCFTRRGNFIFFFHFQMWTPWQKWQLSRITRAQLKAELRRGAHAIYPTEPRDPMPKEKILWEIWGKTGGNDLTDPEKQAQSLLFFKINSILKTLSQKYKLNQLTD